MIGSSLIVCSLRDLPQALDAYDPEIVVSLIGPGEIGPLGTPRCQHLHLDCHDVGHSSGRYRAPDAIDVERLLDAADAWTWQRPFLCHCYAGYSRSWAAAVILACYLSTEHPQSIVGRIGTLAPWAVPHVRMIALADHVIDPPGVLLAAITSMRASGSPQPHAEAAPTVVVPLGPRRSPLAEQGEPAGEPQ